MRIAVLAPRATRVGGTETYVIDLARVLTAAGHDVSLLHLPGPSEPIAGVHIAQIAPRDGIHAQLASLRPDVVHVHDLPVTPTALARLRRDHPLVQSLHNWGHVCASETQLLNGRPCPRAHGPGCLPRAGLARCTERLDTRHALRRYKQLNRELPLLRGGHPIVVHSDYARSVLVRNGIGPERCRVLRYFVARPARPAPQPAEARVAFVGRLSKLKGVAVLLDAVAEVDLGVPVDVVGEGYARGDLERRAARLHLRQVRFLGWTGPDRVRSVLDGAGVVVVPSLWPEPFGIVGLEAMAAARPVIASDTGGIPEWLARDRTGLLVPPADAGALAAALRRLLGDPELRARMGAAGWEAVAEFSASRHLEALETVYREAGSAVTEA